MSKKIGRNDPCPCGSGKKYKKCCGAEQSQGGYVQRPDDWFPESERTGTLWDEYIELIPVFSMYGEKIIQFEKDGKELEEAAAEFEEKFSPGEKDGILDSIFISWMYFDLRFGTSMQTVGERLLADPMMKKINEPGWTYLHQLNDSYLTFFEIKDKSDSEDIVTVEELRTGDCFTVLHARELFEIEPRIGDIWYSRRVGFPDRSILYTTPYIFKPESREGLEHIVEMQVKDFSRGPRAELFPPERYFAETQKQSVLFWADYFVHGAEDEEMMEFDSDFEDCPVLLTTDGEEVVFVEMYFRIRNEEALRKHLARLRSFSYNESDDSWTWLKAKSRKYPDKPRSILGFLRIKDGHLIAETDSRERAAKLRNKLKDHFRDNIAYVKTLYREADDFPELTPEEVEARRRESKAFNEQPEIRAAMKTQLEHHYFVEWPEAKMPALDGATPLKAVKDEHLRPKVIALIEDLEKMQDSPESNMPEIDFDRLRKILGLPPRAH